MKRLTEKQVQILRQKLGDMHRRCEDKSNPAYVDYGARGIRVCEEWSGKDKHSIFRKWAVDNGWCEFLSIDRIDVNGNYEPSNCRWANSRQQANNRRNNNFIEIDGITKTASEWASEVGISFQAFKCRIKYGKVGLELLEKPKTPLKLSKSEMSKEIRKWRYLEDSGKIFTTPYKLNDVVYIIGDNDEIKETSIDGFQIRRLNGGFETLILTPIYDDIRQIGYNTVMLDWVFGTREEAELNLKEWDNFDD